jgi:N-acyl-D-aspartate/D-glutamate deacylase
MRNLTNVEGMSLEALRAGIRWEFETVPEYLATLERNGSGLNLAAFVGHSSVRTFVMRDDAARRAGTAAEVEAMRALVAEGMHAGAIGFATSTSPAHNGDGGIPMPSRLADDAEMFALTGTLRGSRGVFMLTKGGHTQVSFLEEIAARNERPAIIAALLHSNVAPDVVFSDLTRSGRHVRAAAGRCDLVLPAQHGLMLAAPYPFEESRWKPGRAEGRGVPA